VADDARLLAEPFLHLSKRVPEVSMIEPLKLLVIHGWASRIEDRE
jgi:hypothetical protein